MYEGLPTTPEGWAESLTKHGYARIQHPEFPDGSRVRNTGSQYFEAIEDGTAVVWGVFEKKNSSWSQTNRGARDIEIVVIPDPGRGNPFAWQDYRTALARKQAPNEN